MRAKLTVMLTLRNWENIKTGKIRVEPKHLTTEISQVAQTLRLKGGEMGIACITPAALIIYAWRKGR